MRYEHRSHVCNLLPPADCSHKIDGKLAFVALCGGNSLYDEIKECPYRLSVEIREVNHGNV